MGQYNILEVFQSEWRSSHVADDPLSPDALSAALVNGLLSWAEC